MSFHYYTTAEQESALTKIYTDALAVKQAEIDETARTRRIPKHSAELNMKASATKCQIPKFTARGHISRAPRVFDVSGTLITLEGYGQCPTEPLTGGACYTTDPSFDDKITAFLRRHVVYRVIFYPDGRYGPTVGYCSVGMPAMFVSEDGADSLHAEDDDKYDLLCG